MFISEISGEFTQKHPNCPHGVNGSHFFKIVLENKTERGGKHTAQYSSAIHKKDVTAHLTRFSYNLFVYLNTIGTIRILSIFI